MSNSFLRLGTRGSKLALIQAEETKERLARAWPALRAPGAIEIVVVKTTGDKVQDRALSEIGGKGLFAKELEEALFAGTIDVAVHSAKDLPTWLPEGLVLAATLPRQDPRDVLIARSGAKRIADLPQGATVGTSSLRRQAQLLRQRPDLKIKALRGNVDTRLKKLNDGEMDATILALAGLQRLGLEKTVGQPLMPEEMLPAVAQGAIALEIRAGDAKTIKALAPLNHPLTWDRVLAERACLAALRGDCTTPVSVLAEESGVMLRLRAELLLPDGSERLSVDMSGPRAEAEALGKAAGEELRRRASPRHLALLQA